MSHRQSAMLLRELETCHALFGALALMLDNNAMVADYRPLAVLAADGKRKLDALMDLVTDPDHSAAASSAL